MKRIYRFNAEEVARRNSRRNIKLTTEQVRFLFEFEQEHEELIQKVNLKINEASKMKRFCTWVAKWLTPELGFDSREKDKRLIKYYALLGYDIIPMYGPGFGASVKLYWGNEEPPVDRRAGDHLINIDNINELTTSISSFDNTTFFIPKKSVT